MGILIGGMDMPTDGSVFSLVIFSGTGAVAKPKYDKTFRAIDGAKAVAVPPHGRLIDADALVKVLKDHADKMCGLYSLMIESCIERVKDAPTVIDAEVEE